MTARHLKEKEQRLFELLRKYGSLVVAFSGGTDSTYLLYAAKQAIGKGVVAATTVSDIHPERETAAAREFVQKMGIPHVILESGQMESVDFTKNHQSRCYVCKKLMFAAIFAEAKKRGIQHVAHGANTDDDKDFRPGLRAAREMNVAAPLAEAGLTKSDIRALSRKAGLSTWDKPASGCLATRIPYDTEITQELLQLIDKAEQVLLDAGFSGCRVRCHGSLAKIEVPEADMERFLAPENRARIVDSLRQVGFLYVALDLEGFQSGRLNRPLQA